ncbi:MAG: ribonuclease P protein component [Saprospiraceae bacterium]|nr:ribonuclease P protein component [Saprospiraceae bacterium]
MRTQRYTFGRNEKLKHRKDIGRLFEIGKTFAKYPIRALYTDRLETADTNTKCAFTVPKRSFKQAVIRNRLKRRMREAYRLHKHLLVINTNQRHVFHLLFIYTGNEELPYRKIEKAIHKILRKIADAEL